MVENNIQHKDLIPDLVEVNYIVDNPDTVNNSNENDSEHVLLIDQNDRSVNYLEDMNDYKGNDCIVEQMKMKKIVVDDWESLILKDKIFVDVEQNEDEMVKNFDGEYDAYQVSEQMGKKSREREVVKECFNHLMGYLNSTIGS